jgi:hypothetical protein
VHLAHQLGVKAAAYRRVKNDERDAADLAWTASEEGFFTPGRRSQSRGPFPLLLVEDTRANRTAHS